MKPSLCITLATVSVLGCLLLSGCGDGKDGDPGPKGPDGVDGPPGPDGNSGKDGNGYPESVAYGNIVISFAGKLTDGKNFADTVNFRHAPLGIDGFMIGSLATVSDDFYNFSIRRYYGAVDLLPDLQDNFVQLNLSVIPDNSGNIVIPNECTIRTYMHASATKLVAVDRNFADILTVEDFENYQYNATTGDLSFRLTFKDSRPQMSVEVTELNITLVATLKVLQRIEQAP
jgi:hypothetical protein